MESFLYQYNDLLHWAPVVLAYVLVIALFAREVIR